MVEKSSKLISKVETPSPEEMEIINKNIPVKNFDKGTVLLREGEVAKESYYVVKGCVRSYYLVDGNELTTAFYIENESCAAMSSYINQQPSTHYLECVEDCTLSVLTFENEQTLIKKYPKFESLCRNTVESDFGKTQEMFAKFITKSPEERYSDILKNRPDLLQRVPQYYLASYLGVKPESLSRIRKRMAQK
jgi:CRP-like cAMP-binding protein